MCELATSSAVATRTNDAGVPMVVHLSLTGVTNPKAVFDSVDLTGLRADAQVSGREVELSFNLARVENRQLRSFVLPDEV